MAFAAETYEDYEQLINSLVDKFFYARKNLYQKIGLDRSDLVSVANELFLKAYMTHDDSLGPFSSRVRFVIWNGMLDAFQTEYTKVRKRSILTDSEGQPADLDILPFPARSTFSLKGFRSALSWDACEAIKLAIYPPKSVKEQAEKNGGSPRNYRSAIRKYLMTTYGFTPYEVAECFSEIATALKTYDPIAKLDT